MGGVGVVEYQSIDIIERPTARPWSRCLLWLAGWLAGSLGRRCWLPSTRLRSEPLERQTGRRAGPQLCLSDARGECADGRRVFQLVLASGESSSKSPSGQPCSCILCPALTPCVVVRVQQQKRGLTFYPVSSLPHDALLDSRASLAYEWLRTWLVCLMLLAIRLVTFAIGPTLPRTLAPSTSDYVCHVYLLFRCLGPCHHGALFASSALQ